MKVSKTVLLASLTGVLMCTAGMLAGNDGALAKKASEAIRVNYANIKLFINGKEIKTSAEPFTYNGNVYVPAATIANMFGIGQEWDNSTPAVRFEGLDRVTSSPQYMGMLARQSYPYPLDYVYSLRWGSNGNFDSVINVVNGKQIPLPKMESTGTLREISRIVHADMFYMLETNSQGTFINGYKIDKVESEIAKVFSRQIEPVTGTLSFNEATREFTEKIYQSVDGKAKLVGVKVYQIDWDNVITKTEELLGQ
ncbi:stalk domain-containing protein [Brevibacillus sp. TJ4]|uniref:stalk domain-containing protein n=1 Tax=Brevibacillus sp. TJ4 TaxID=3234853 RepID=UPI0037D9579C